MNINWQCLKRPPGIKNSIRKSNRAAPRHRASCGNVLLSIMALTFLLSLVILLAICFSSLFLVQSHVRTTGEEAALALALGLNSGDRLGEINHMTQYARELVVDSRRTYNLLEKNSPHLANLSNQLLLDARQGARLVDCERAALVSILGKELESQCDNLSSDMEARGPVDLSFYRISPLSINELAVGNLVDVPSNAELSVAFPELQEHDLAEEYTYRKTTYLKGGINARLPAPDDDLDFKLSSLSPAIDGTITPARLVSQNESSEIAPISKLNRENAARLKQLPSTISIRFKTSIISPALGLRQELTLESRAATSGSQCESPGKNHGDSDTETREYLESSKK